MARGDYANSVDGVEKQYLLDRYRARANSLEVCSQLILVGFTIPDGQHPTQE